MSLPASPLRLLPTAATFVGWDFHPLKFRAFSRRTMDGQDKNLRAGRRETVEENFRRSVSTLPVPVSFPLSKRQENP